MTYERPRIQRRSLLGQMISKASLCAQQGGIWDGQDCKLP